MLFYQIIEAASKGLHPSLELAQKKIRPEKSRFMATTY